MSHPHIWNFWSKHYQHLWVQKTSLQPTRKQVLKLVNHLNIKHDQPSLLDIGCGVGQLLHDIAHSPHLRKLCLNGLDYSEKMISRAQNLCPEATYYNQCVTTISHLPTTFDVITSTHSLPYYKDQKAFFGDVSHLLKTHGHFIVACASINTTYDKAVMSLVKLTTGKANYPSHDQVLALATPYFDLIDVYPIKVKPWMPSILVWHFKKRS